MKLIQELTAINEAKANAEVTEDAIQAFIEKLSFEPWEIFSDDFELNDDTLFIGGSGEALAGLTFTGDFTTNPIKITGWSSYGSLDDDDVSTEGDLNVTVDIYNPTNLEQITAPILKQLHAEVKEIEDNR